VTTRARRDVGCPAGGNRFDPVIFDCDGVLVDSEHLAGRTEAEILSALDAITVPSCVASSGSHDRMRSTLGTTGLLERFDGRIFSVDDVWRGKPAPDVSLFAAERMGASPDRCAVVEDSVSGVTVGLAADMAVVAFAGGVTRADVLAIDDAVVFGDMQDLPSRLGPT